MRFRAVRTADGRSATIKLHNKIETPILLDMAPFVVEGDNITDTFRRVAVVHHKGPTPWQGHYYTTVARRDQTFHVDNARTTTHNISPTDSTIADNVFYVIYQRQGDPSCAFRLRRLRETEIPTRRGAPTWKDILVRRDATNTADKALVIAVHSVMGRNLRVTAPSLCIIEQHQWLRAADIDVFS